MPSKEIFLFVVLFAAVQAEAECGIDAQGQSTCLEEADEATLLQAKLRMTTRKEIALEFELAADADPATTKILKGIPIYNYHLAHAGGMKPSLLELSEKKSWVVVFKKGATDEQMKKFCKSKCPAIGHPDEGGEAYAEIEVSEKELEELTDDPDTEFLTNNISSIRNFEHLVYLQHDFNSTFIERLTEVLDFDDPMGIVECWDFYLGMSCFLFDFEGSSCVLYFNDYKAYLVRDRKVKRFHLLQNSACSKHEVFVFPYFFNQKQEIYIDDLPFKVKSQKFYMPTHQPSQHLFEGIQAPVGSYFAENGQLRQVKGAYQENPTGFCMTKLPQIWPYEFDEDVVTFKIRYKMKVYAYSPHLNKISTAHTLKPDGYFQEQSRFLNKAEVRKSLIGHEDTYNLGPSSGIKTWNQIKESDEHFLNFLRVLSGTVLSQFESNTISDFYYESLTTFTYLKNESNEALARVQRSNVIIHTEEMD